MKKYRRNRRYLTVNLFMCTDNKKIVDRDSQSEDSL